MEATSSDGILLRSASRCCGSFLSLFGSDGQSGRSEHKPNDWENGIDGSAKKQPDIESATAN